MKWIRYAEKKTLHFRLSKSTGTSMSFENKEHAQANTHVKLEHKKVQFYTDKEYRLIRG